MTIPIDEYYYTVYIDDKQFEGWLEIPSEPLTLFGRNVLAYIVVRNVSGVKPGVKRVIIQWPKRLFLHVLNPSNILFEIDGRILIHHGVVAHIQNYTTEHAIAIDSQFTSLKIYIFQNEEMVQSNRTVIGYLHGIREILTMTFRFPKQITDNFRYADATSFSFCFPMSMWLKNTIPDIPTALRFFIHVLEPISTFTAKFFSTVFSRVFWECAAYSEIYGSLTFAFTFPRGYFLYPTVYTFSFVIPRAIGHILDLMQHKTPVFPFVLGYPITLTSFFDSTSAAFYFPRTAGLSEELTTLLSYATAILRIPPIVLMWKTFEYVFFNETRQFVMRLPKPMEFISYDMCIRTFVYVLSKYHYVVPSSNAYVVPVISFLRDYYKYYCDMYIAYYHVFSCQYEFDWKQVMYENHVPIITKVYGICEEIDIPIYPLELQFFKYVSLNPEFKLELFLLDPETKWF